MRTSAQKTGSPYLHSFQVDLSCPPVRRWVNGTLDAAIQFLTLVIVLLALIVSFSAKANSQSRLILPDMSASDGTPANDGAPASDGNSTPDTPTAIPDFTYTSPSEKNKLHNYLFDAFGPCPIAGAAVAAGFNQLSDSPPEWKQGFAGYSKRFGSNFGMVAIGSTTRYALAEALQEDTLYYPCICSGILPRLGHASISTFTARRQRSGRRIFSLPNLIAPYAGSFSAVYGWYPDRFGAKDAFRIGNYNLLAYMGGNIALEFLYSGPHSLLSRLHIAKPSGATDPAQIQGANSAPQSGLNQ